VVYNPEKNYGIHELTRGIGQWDRQVLLNICGDGTSSGTKATYKVAIVAPTCFYYQAPVFRELAVHQRIDLTVYFCSKEGLKGQDIRKLFKADGKWGIEEEILQGYNHKFLKNFSPWPSYFRRPFGLCNLGIWREFEKSRPHVIVLMDWTDLTWWLAMLASLRFRIPFLYTKDASLDADLSQPKWKQWAKSLALRNVVFRLAAGVLSSGTTNSLWYKHYGLPSNKIVPFAYSSVQQSFLSISDGLKSQRQQLRAHMGIPAKSCVVLFCGRLLDKKGVFHLLRAYGEIKRPDSTLVFVGDGEHMEELKRYVAQHNLDAVHFVGFQGRHDIPKFYAMSDIFVLPSLQDTWGMVVGEAMCFGLPVIVSDQVGSGADLVIHGENGFRFPGGDVNALSNCIKRAMEMTEEERSAMGRRSTDLIRKWKSA